MAEDLRKNLGKAKAESNMRQAEDRAKHAEGDHARTDDHFSRWNEALDAYASGWKRPQPRFPVVISPKSPVSTPEKLQKLAGMKTIPKVIEVTYTTLDGEPDKKHLDKNGQPEKVNIGEVSWKELQNIQSKTDYDHFSFVRLGEDVRGVTLVTSMTKSERGR